MSEKIMFTLQAKIEPTKGMFSKKPSPFCAIFVTRNNELCPDGAFLKAKTTWSVICSRLYMNFILFIVTEITFSF